MEFEYQPSEAEREMKRITVMEIMKRLKPKFQYTKEDLLSDGKKLDDFYQRWRNHYDVHGKPNVECFKKKIRAVYYNPQKYGMNSIMDIDVAGGCVIDNPNLNILQGKTIHLADLFRHLGMKRHGYNYSSMGSSSSVLVDPMAPGDVAYRCFVSGLAWTTDSQALKEAFSRYGEILESKIIRDQTGRSRGFAFVTFANEASMREAIKNMNGQILDSCNITVEEAQSRGSGGGYRGSSGGGSGGRYDGSRDRNGGGGGYVGNHGGVGYGTCYDGLHGGGGDYGYGSDGGYGSGYGSGYDGVRGGGAYGYASGYDGLRGGGNRGYGSGYDGLRGGGNRGYGSGYDGLPGGG